MPMHTMNDLAITHTKLALQHAHLESEVNRSIIEALQSRYLPQIIATENPEERNRLNFLYASKFKEVYEKFPLDCEVLHF